MIKNYAWCSRQKQLLSLVWLLHEYVLVQPKGCGLLTSIKGAYLLSFSMFKMSSRKVSLFFSRKPLTSYSTCNTDRATRTALCKSLRTSTLTCQCTRPLAELHSNAAGMCQDPNFGGQRALQLPARKWLLAINLKTNKKNQPPTSKQKWSETAAEICLRVGETRNPLQGVRNSIHFTKYWLCQPMPWSPNH